MTDAERALGRGGQESRRGPAGRRLGGRAGRTRIRVAIPALLCLGLALPTSHLVAQSEETPRPVAIDDLFRLARVGDPVVSPEGDWVAYTVVTTSLKDEKSTTRLWMVGRAGGEPVPMTREGESVSAPQWSPDGRFLSFLATRGEGAKAQVWALDRRGGEARALTSVEQGVTEYRWSPDGSSLALIVRDPEVRDTTRKEGAPREPWVIDRLQFKRDNQGYLADDRQAHLYVFDLEAGRLSQLTDGPWDERGPVWSPDGTRIAFVSNRTPDPDANQNTDVWVVPARLEDPTDRPIRVTSNPGPDTSPAWSPDGRLIAHVSVVRPDLIWYATRHLAVIEAPVSVQLSGADPTPPSLPGASRDEGPGMSAVLLTEELDRNVSDPRFGRDGRIYFRVEDSAEDHLVRISADGTGMTRLTAGPLSVGGFDLGPEDGPVVRVARTDLPGELFRVVAGGREGRPGELLRLTEVNDSLLASLSLGEVREVHWRSPDGNEVEGFVHFPADFVEGEPRPLLLRPHGGPVSQYRHSFNFEAHLFAANGYVVLTPNPRGSSGYGQEFSAALWANWGTPDFRDVMAGVDHLIERGWVDGDRMGVGGWSYGGILTNYVITQTDRFKGAISGASEVLYIANYGHDHYQLQWEAELGLPWEGENRRVWERLSPFNRVEQITTPTLLMGGERDWNVPILNSEQMYQALRRRGVPTQLVVYPGQGHGLRVPSYQKDRLERYLAWYGRWVLGSPSGEGPVTDER